MTACYSLTFCFQKMIIINDKKGRSDRQFFCYRIEVLQGTQLMGRTFLFEADQLENEVSFEDSLLTVVLDDQEATFPGIGEIRIMQRNYQGQQSIIGTYKFPFFAYLHLEGQAVTKSIHFSHLFSQGVLLDYSLQVSKVCSALENIRKKWLTQEQEPALEGANLVESADIPLQKQVYSLHKRPYQRLLFQNQVVIVRQRHWSTEKTKHNNRISFSRDIRTEEDLEYEGAISCRSIIKAGSKCCKPKCPSQAGKQKCKQQTQSTISEFQDQSLIESQQIGETAIYQNQKTFSKRLIALPKINELPTSKPSKHLLQITTVKSQQHYLLEFPYKTICFSTKIAVLVAILLLSGFGLSYLFNFARKAHQAS